MPDAAPARTWAVMEAELLYPPTTTIVSLSAAAAARRARGVGIGAREVSYLQAGRRARQAVCEMHAQSELANHKTPAAGLQRQPGMGGCPTAQCPTAAAMAATATLLYSQVEHGIIRDEGGGGGA
jgi:hypothetical protein